MKFKRGDAQAFFVSAFRNAILLVVCFGWSSAAAQSVDQQISHLINLGQIEVAETILEASNPDEVDRLFFAGRIHKALQQYPKAVAIFEEILRRDPKHINAKRELAHTLLLSGKLRAAEVHFGELLRVDQNEIMLNGYRRFLNVIERSKTSGVNLQFALLPSTNVNKGTDNTVFDTDLGEFIIDPSMQAEPGIGAQLGVSGFFRQPIALQSHVQLNWGISATRYGNETYDSETGHLSVSFEKTTAEFNWNLESYFRQSWREDGVDMNVVGLKYDLTQKLSPSNNLVASLTHEYRSYPIIDYQNGAYTSAAVSVSHRLNKHSTILGGVQAEFSHPEAEHLQYAGLEAFASISNKLSNGMQVALRIELGNREFVGPYPLTANPRADSYSGFSFSIHNDRINYRGFVPNLSCKQTNNSSNVSFFDYVASDCKIAFIQNF